ncbi:hypothetical protein AciM339_0742 [Aciduliprofundum sp. MAR08-339]|nr:hypothetical protein AciM339_0742 [Aciduliprofundum sp. MAR08-339]
MKNDFLTNIKYIFIFNKYYILISLTLVFFISLIASYDQANSFSQWYFYYIAHSKNINYQDIINQIENSFSMFWFNSIFMISIFVFPIASIVTSKYEVNDMNQYVLMFNYSRISVFLSYLISLIVMGFLIILVNWIIFIFIFYYLTGFLEFYFSLFFFAVVTFILLLFLGGAIGFLIRKTSWSVIISIFLFILLLMVSAMAYNNGINYLEHLHNISSVQEYRNAFPLVWKILVFLNPIYIFRNVVNLLLYPQTISISSQISLVDFPSIIFLYLVWYISVILVGYFIFVYRHPIRKVVKNE